MNNIQVFQSEQFGQIRTAVTEAGDPLFCLMDICKVLGLSNPSIVAKKLDSEELPKLDLGGRNGVTNFVTEPGMYTVILRSDSPKAKPMQKWITSEVLPSIRKTGGYIAASTQESPEEIMARALVVAQDTIKRSQEKARMLVEQNKLQQQQLEVAAPKVQYYNEVLMSQSTYTTTQIAKELGMGAQTLNERLRRAGVQYKQSGQWLLTFKYQNRGLTKTHTYTFTHADGSPGSALQTVWTEKGRKFIHDLIGQ